MEKKFNTLMNRLEYKGFTSFEIPALIHDVVSICQGKFSHSVSTLNRELEDLGWGINLLDEMMYDLFISLLKWDRLQQSQRYHFRSFYN